MSAVLPRKVVADHNGFGVKRPHISREILKWQKIKGADWRWTPTDFKPILRRGLNINSFQPTNVIISLAVLHWNLVTGEKKSSHWPAWCPGAAICSSCRTTRPDTDKTGMSCVAPTNTFHMKKFASLSLVTPYFAGQERREWHTTLGLGTYDRYTEWHSRPRCDGNVRSLRNSAVRLFDNRMSK